MEICHKRVWFAKKPRFKMMGFVRDAAYKRLVKLARNWGSCPTSTLLPGRGLRRSALQRGPVLPPAAEAKLDGTVELKEHVELLRLYHQKTHCAYWRQAPLLPGADLRSFTRTNKFGNEGATNSPCRRTEA